MNQDGSTIRFRTMADMAEATSSPVTAKSMSMNPFDSISCNEVPSLIRTDESLFLSPENEMKSETSFRWTIDEVSACKPADIEVNINQFDVSDKLDDSLPLQTHIHNNNIIVPSPIQKILSKDQPKKPKSTKNVSVSVQTNLSLPVHLPENVQKILEPFFNKSEIGPFTTSPPQLQAIHFNSPLFKKDDSFILNAIKRTETPLRSNQNRFSDCSISPIDNYRHSSLNKENCSANYQSIVPTSSLAMMDISYEVTPKSKSNKKHLSKNLSMSFMEF